MTNDDIKVGGEYLVKIGDERHVPVRVIERGVYFSRKRTDGTTAKVCGFRIERENGDRFLATASQLHDRVHAFEKAGLGAAPFAYVGVTSKTYQACPGAPVQPGACCDYCGTGISEVHMIRSADGRESEIGSDCIGKVGDEGLRKHVAAAKRIKDREARGRRADRVEAELAELLDSPAVRAKLEAMPSPIAWRAEQGETWLHNATWLRARSGAAGRARLLKVIKALAA